MSVPIPAFRRTPALQGSRGLAMLAVFLFHFSGQVGRATGESTGFWVPVGPLGTNWFLLLSATLAYVTYCAAPVGWGRFVWRRVIRLYPAYLSILGLYFVLSWLFPSASKVPAEGAWLYALQNMILLPGIYPARGMMTVAWTLVWLFAFFLVFPLLMRLLGTKHRLPRLVLLLAAALLVTRLTQVEHRAVFLAEGLLLGEVLRRASGWRPQLVWWLGAGMALIVIRHLWLWQGWDAAWLSAYVENLGLGLALYATAQLDSRTWLGRRLAGPIAEAMGRLSYSFYLAHGLALKFLFVLVVPRLGWGSAGELWALLPLAFGLAVAGSCLLYWWAEEPGRWPWLPAARPQRNPGLAFPGPARYSVVGEHS